MANYFQVVCSLVVLAVTIQAIDWNKNCTPGEIWKSDCHTCTCTNQGKPSCTRELCPSDAIPNSKVPLPASKSAEDDEDSPACTPGDKWVEDCNNCICDNAGQPECSRRLCA